jgi:hypothetical protein
VDDLGALGLLAFFAAFIAGRFIHERALRALTAEQKGQMMDAFSRQRQFSLVPLLAVVVLALVFPGLIPFWALLPLLLLYIVGTLVYALRKMRTLELPQSYVRTYSTSQAVQFGGVLFYFATLRGWLD